MAFFSDLEQHIGSLRARCGEQVEGADVPAVAARLGEDELIEVLEQTTAAIRMLETVRMSAAGAAARLSAREHGHSGLAQKRGHRTPVALVQHILGTTRGDAVQQVRLGQTLLEGADASRATVDETGPSDEPLAATAVAAPAPWHAALGAAILAGDLTTDQHDAIRRGLGEPPADASDTGDGEQLAAVCEAWRCAAEQLIPEAPRCSVEELAKAARQVRDMLDPDGASRRFEQRYESRSFRIWQDPEGAHHAHIDFDDEMAAWVKTIIGSALRPRRGGPRFADAEERERAQHLVDDPRTNDQLTYDLIIDTLRAGALADPKAVFGTRQAGVRIVTTEGALTRDGHGRPTGTAFFEDGGEAVPAWLADRALCESGRVPCTVDAFGNPLDVGREHRLFTPKQRIALSIRDGGCRWEGCSMPGSYCEAHHIDHFVEHEGRTDIDRGILLCRFHHLLLHNNGWRIRRDGKSEFMLHPPGGEPVPLRSRSPLRHNWLSPPEAA